MGGTGKKGEKEAKEETAFVYVLECEDGSFYTGITKDIGQRMKTHFQKKSGAAKYTKSHKPRRLKMVWRAESYSAAAKLEYAIKRLKRDDKCRLIAGPEEGVGIFFPQLAEFVYLPCINDIAEMTDFC